LPDLDIFWYITRVRPIHERVRAHVTRDGRPAAEIAVEAGWSKRRLNRLISGQTHLRADDMEVLSGVLKKRIGTLYREPRKARAS
jgi:hypothetical protein